jgi:hypothetical protein
MADKPPLDLFLQAAQGGGWTGSIQTSEQKALDQVRAYDPDARFETQGGGEGGGEQTYLRYDPTKLPEFKGDMTRAVNANTVYGLKDKSKVTKDEVWGDWTTSDNVLQEKDPLWTVLAPIAVGALAPMASAAFLASTGIGLGAAGTAAVTGGAAGLSAANIATGGTASFMSNLAAKAPQLARSKGNTNSLISAAAGAAGIPYSQFIAPALALARGATAKPQPKPMDPRIAQILALAAKRGR